ncbi:peptidoglycan-associated lipoprotein Pal [Pseudoprimorskyibacter insulae]|uniref:Peptidoglycan-associated lipoprotein n=1 Tax=Pseudoprimorskyibacter insulae TaxID=1695997 RepID=A0A2R8AVE6_9RHOB|nr:peptidoglycan-associated lipoprotein Pal [Pseudoprimorskyibacter insulae]SPF79980.1 Outer membrane lipoprotein Omp16 [Pseudoprimorskyibacter insulae]
MTMLKTLTLLGAALALTACADAGRFGRGNGDDFANNGAGAGYNDTLGGGLGDPASAEYFQQAIGDRVFFVVDQSSLTPEGRATLDAQASWLMTNSDYLAVIEGHADEQGTREYNLALGARRANAVMEYLVSRGVSSNRLKFVSYGKERPVEVCSDESCYSKNRRAVTIISASLSG